MQNVSISLYLSLYCVSLYFAFYFLLFLHVFIFCFFVLNWGQWYNHDLFFQASLMKPFKVAKQCGDSFGNNLGSWLYWKTVNFTKINDIRNEMMTIPLYPSEIKSQYICKPKLNEYIRCVLIFGLLHIHIFTYSV